MATSPPASREFAFEAVFPSDSLVGFRDFLRSVPALAPLAQQLIQLRLVIDANIVHEELRWLLRRRNPAARSALQEAIDSGVVVPLAPRFLDAEIEEHIDEIADDMRRPPNEVRQHWHSFRSRLHLYEPAEMIEDACALVDPDDVPYKVACDELGADAVYSRDGHLTRMNVPVINRLPNLALRDYARSSSVAVGISFSSGLILTVSFASMRGIYVMVEKAFETIGNLPAWAKFILAAGVIAAVAHPKSRAKLAEVWARIRDGVDAITPGLSKGLEIAAVQFLESHTSASQKRAEVLAALPEPRRRSVIQYARSICLVSKTPLSAVEIEARMRSEGYQSSAANPVAYLRKRLRANRQFVEVTPGQWALSPLSPIGGE